jgi:hypothetical protein
MNNDQSYKDGMALFESRFFLVDKVCKLFRARKNKWEEPSGYFETPTIFILDPEEICDCCKLPPYPVRIFTLEYYNHACTLDHIINLISRTHNIVFRQSEIDFMREVTNF